MFKAGVVLALFGVAAANFPTYTPPSNSTLPVVDLGYEIHQASNFNETGRFYNFSNIRYAAPPVGELRFAPPEAPAENRSQIQTGDVGRICFQAGPAWSVLATQFLVRQLLQLPNNITGYIPPDTDSGTSSDELPPPDGRETEDCLFLDVFVPESILNSAGKGKGAPVLVWIYGGGYTLGNKYNNPAGLFAASGNVTDGEVIYVALNYRLGTLGWTSGPTYQAEGGTGNLGLHDQRFGLEWVQKYIHLFGGDKDKVTVFGESAGGGSIMHQITAYGGANGSVPFQRAIPQSPGWIPVNSVLQQDDAYSRILNLTNSTSLSDLRALSSEQIRVANYLQIIASPWGTYAYGPTVDGDISPGQPGQLLAQGRYDKNVSVMVGHNSMEAPYFTPPYINSTEDLIEHIRGAFPYMPQPSIDYITQTLYPEVFNGSYGYSTQYERATLMVQEAIFTCNTFFLSTAFDNETYSYLFAVPPAYHGADVSFTYYTGGPASPIPFQVTNTTVAVALQELITSFAATGVPEADDVPEFRMYGEEGRVLKLDATGIEEVQDSNKNARCVWWQKSLIS